MKYLVVIATLVVSCMAAPANSSPASLERPSPIAPSVLIDSKPTEKVNPIEDKKEPEVHKAFYPTVLPAEVAHHVSKRDTVSSSKAPAELTKNSEIKPQTLQVHTLPLQAQNHRDIHATPAKYEHAAATNFQKPQAGIHHNEQHENIGPSKPTPPSIHKPQTLPAIGNENKQHKRDVPAAFAVKDKQSQVAAKDDSSEEDSKEKNDAPTNTKKEHKPLVASHNDKVQVEDLSEPKPINNKHSIGLLQHHAHEFHPQTKHPNSEEKKPITLGDVQQKPVTQNVGAAEASSGTTEHPVIRPKPVPVSELFSRQHDN